MNIQKLPSGSYRVRQQINGKRYSVVFDHKPNMAEIGKAFNEKAKVGITGTFDAAAMQYIEAKRATLSPSTIRAYEAYLKNMPDHFKLMKLSEINTLTVQKVINEYALSYSPKYTRNINGFISAVLGVFSPETILRVSLPKKSPTKDVRPSDEDISRILKKAEGTMYEVAIWLACYGLRRSEQICLCDDDLDGNILTINKAMVQNSNLEWVLKTTKTEDSTRQIYLSDHVVDLIHKNGFYKGKPNSILAWLHRTQDELGIPRFSLHFFRHYFASKMSTVTDEATLLKMGGWKTDYVMKSRYRYAMDENILKAQKDSAAVLDSLKS